MRALVLLASAAVVMTPCEALSPKQPRVDITRMPEWAECQADGPLSDDAPVIACTKVISALGRARDARPYARRCSLLLDRNRVDEALADCTRAIKLDPKNTDALHTRIVANLSLQKNDLAIADGTALLRLLPPEKRAGTLYLRGTAYSQKGDFDRAIDDFTVSLQLFPGFGMAEGGLRDAREAKARLAAGQKPGDPRAWCDGKSLPGEGFHYDLQIKGCTALIESGKESADDLVRDYYQRGDAHSSEMNYDLATADFWQVVRLKPSHADAWLRLGAIAWVRHNHDEAISDLSNAIRYNVQKLYAYEYRGQSYVAVGKYDLAIADFNHMLQVEPDNAGAYVNLCRARIGKGELDRAIADCDLAIKHVRTSEATEGWNGRGDAHYLKGDFASAITDYQKALGLWPEYPEALYGRGAARLRHGDTGGQADLDAARKFKPEVEAAETRIGIVAR